MARTRRVHRARFLCAAHTLQQLPSESRPEIAFAGRSNVGKSSLLNALAGRKALAKVSRSPGKTQSINFFDVDGTVYWVDLPGYGYAQVSQKLRAQWGRLIGQYLETRAALRLVVCLSDSRRPPTPLDVQLVEWLNHIGVPWIGVLTKSDKLNQAQRAKAERAAREAYGAAPDQHVFLCSATTGRGLQGLREHLAPDAWQDRAGDGAAVN